MDGLDEPGGPVDVPHPGVLEGELEEDLPAAGAYLDVNGIGQVEPPFSLHHVGEQGGDIAVLPVQRELQLVLIGLEVFCAHRAIMPARSLWRRQAAGASRPCPRVAPGLAAASDGASVMVLIQAGQVPAASMLVTGPQGSESPDVGR